MISQNLHVLQVGHMVGYHWSLASTIGFQASLIIFCTKPHSDFSLLQGIFWPKNWTWVSRIAGRCFTDWATREAPLNNKQNKNTNQIISRQEYQSHSALPIRGKTNKQKLSTNLTLYETYTKHWANFRREETRRKKEFNFEAWEKETSNTPC